MRRRGRRIPRRRVPSFAPDGVEFKALEPQLIVRRSFCGQYRAFCRFAARPIVPENLHAPRCVPL
ncbi:MAG: hypothetical protein IPM54_10190 [Polyangiaceae bacterium]|nr:hypothetical protein [Polyangiaceae bacterium]